MRKPISLIIAIILLSSPAYSQYSAVLVMLRAEKKKAQNYEKKGDQASANELREEAKKIMTATIKDYTDHFSYLPGLLFY